MAECEVALTPSLEEAVRQLQQQEYTAAVVDQLLIESDPDGTELLLQHLGMAMPVFVNFAICGMERFLREVKIALRRRVRELEAARASVEGTLRNELKGSLTAMLLSCELVLRAENLPAEVLQKLIRVNDLALEMSGKLGAAE
jgi:hypothetical protein